MSSRKYKGSYRIGKIDADNFHTRGGANTEKKARKLVAELSKANPDNVYGYGKVEVNGRSPSVIADFVGGEVIIPS